MYHSNVSPTDSNHLTVGESTYFYDTLKKRIDEENKTHKG